MRGTHESSWLWESCWQWSCGLGMVFLPKVSSVSQKGPLSFPKPQPLQKTNSIPFNPSFTRQPFFFFNGVLLFNVYLCIYLILTMLGLCCCEGFSLTAASGDYSLLQHTSFSLQWLLLQSTGSRQAGFSNCSTQAALRHVASSPINLEPEPVVSCISRQILYHWATRGAPHQATLNAPTLLDLPLKWVSLCLKSHPGTVPCCLKV